MSKVDELCGDSLMLKQDSYQNQNGGANPTSPLSKVDEPNLLVWGGNAIQIIKESQATLLSKNEPLRRIPFALGCLYATDYRVHI